MGARIMIVEDEPELAAVIADYARAAGYLPTMHADGAQALAAIRTAPPDLRGAAFGLGWSLGASGDPVRALRMG